MTEAASANDAEIRRQSKTLSAVFWTAWIIMAATLAGKHVVWPIVRIVGGAIEREPWRAVVNDVGLNLIEALPAIILLFGVYAAQRMFARMGEGEVFSVANVAELSRIGESMLWAAAASIIISPTLAGWVRHDTTIDVQFSDWALLLGVLGAAVLFMGRVLALANRIKQENDQIV
jgi:hypothetical protein